MKETIGFAVTGSFCTFDRIINEFERLVSKGYNVIPILSQTAANTDTRFTTAKDFKDKIQSITNNKPLTTIEECEPIGPKGILDLLLIAPATGNTVAKIANAITDTSVTMAAKAHLRNGKPLVIGVSTNDGLSGNAVNIAKLLTRKNIYFVPFGQDDCINKSYSLMADFTLIPDTVAGALKGEQIQPLLL